MIRIVIAEDQSLVRGALASLLGLEADMEVIAQAADGPEALKIVSALPCEVLLTDIEMPGLSGIDLTARALAEKPGLKVLILTTFARPGYLERAMKAGALGYLLKDAPSEELARAVRQVAGGRRHVSPELAAEALMGGDPLTERERDVLRAAEAGHSNKEIGRLLGLSPGTVRNYLADAMHKTGAGNRIEAFRQAREKGWL
jgi:two-component system response regulator DesR